MITVRIDQDYQNDLLKQISENFDEYNIKEQRPTQLILQILKVQSLKVCLIILLKLISNEIDAKFTCRFFLEFSKE